MPSPIFDTLTAQRDATPVFESLTRGLDDPMWSFETATPPAGRGTTPPVATWPLRATPR